MDVSIWLRDLGLADYAQAFRANDIDAAVLRRLTAEDLIALGISSIGHRRKLLDAIAELARPDRGVQREPEAPRAAERRQLTVLFCDLVGSTALAAGLDPEDMAGIIRAYHSCCANVVERWGGHVAKYMGDGVLAYFGWPMPMRTRPSARSERDWSSPTASRSSTRPRPRRLPPGSASPPVWSWSAS